MPRRVFITAAEVSGDQHAARLVRSLRQLDPEIIVEGHGGPAMEAAGTILHHETTARAAMAMQALRRVGEMWRLLRWTKRYFARSQPDLVVCVDSPETNLHFARAAHRRGIPVLYYIAPQVWAWREGRVKRIRRDVDRIACILPFEEEYFRGHGIDARFVGHPLFDEPGGREEPNGPRFPDRPPVIGLLPGSRHPEATANFARLLRVADIIRSAFPDASFLVPTTPATHPVVEKLVRDRRDTMYREGAFDEMVARCDLCLTVSGTATLHVAKHRVPMIVVYHGNPIAWHLVGRWIIKARTFSLVNLLSGSQQHIVPEFIPWYGSIKAVADLALEYLRDPAKLAEQREKLGDLVARLDHPGASMNVAKLAMEMMGSATGGGAEAQRRSGQERRGQEP